MAREKAPWFVVERSEALAGLLLTSRNDVRIQSEKKQDDGVDFLVAVDEGGESFSTRLFMAQVRGTIASDRSEWLTGVIDLFQPPHDSIYLPTCVVVVNVRDNHSVYAWVAEPLVEAGGAKLRFPPPADFHAFDRAAVDEIVSRVKAWYGILSRQLVPTAG